MAPPLCSSTPSFSVSSGVSWRTDKDRPGNSVLRMVVRVWSIDCRREGEVFALSSGDGSVLSITYPSMSYFSYLATQVFEEFSSSIFAPLFAGEPFAPFLADFFGDLLFCSEGSTRGIFSSIWARISFTSSAKVRLRSSCSSCEYLSRREQMRSRGSFDSRNCFLYFITCSMYCSSWSRIAS